MAVLTKNTEIIVHDVRKVSEVFNAKPNPSKAAFDRIKKAKENPIYRGKIKR